MGPLEEAQVRGEAGRFWREGRTPGEVFTAVREALEAEEAAEERRKQFERARVDWLCGRPTRIRHPRRKLRAWLAGR